MDQSLQKELSTLVESALKLKEENEKLHDQLKEVKRLLALCHAEDRSDLVLTVQLIRDAVHGPSVRTH